MANYIGIPLKKTNEVDLVKPLKNLFSSYCISADEPVQYDSALNELNKLRINSTWRTLDKHESSLDVMTRYYDQLYLLETKCPVADFPVSFKWKDAFDKGSIFMGISSLTLSNLLFERICILFNIGAMQSQIAVSHGADTRNDEGLKLAAKYFQLSSGTFQHLKSLVPELRQDPTPDLQQDTLSAIQVLMLAQAHESFFHKAVADNMKDSIIAKLAAQTAENYGEALRNMQKDAQRVVWDKDTIMMVAGKQSGFEALTQFYQSLVCKATKDVGEEISRLNWASELLKLCEVRSAQSYTGFKDYMSKVNYNYNEAKKDNDFIYHARVPEVKSLQPVGKAQVAKSTSLPEKLNPNSQDLFPDLLPMPVQQAVQAFETRKAEIVNLAKTRILSQTQLLNGILASLNLPAALEDTTGDTLPQSIRDKAQAVQAKGGFDYLQTLFEELPGHLQRNKEILQECTRMLQDEEETDNTLRSQFKNRWSRTPSAKLNEPLKSGIEKYNKIVGNAISADAVVKQKYAGHREKIMLLCLPEDELVSRVPKGSPVSVSSSGEQLKRLMDQVNELLSERTALKDELEGTTFDMKSKFLTALSQDGAINEQNLSAEKIEEIYGAIQRRIDANLDRQDKIVAEIQKVNMEFCKDKDVKQSAADRETMLKDLAAAHDVFFELSGNLEEGTKFYNNLTQILVVFQNKISDFCFARKTEKDELCKELQANIVSEANKQETPAAPAHHNQNIRPTRPPPPRMTTAPSAVIPPATTNVPSTGPYNVPTPTAATTVPGTIPNQPLPYPTYPTYMPPYPYPTMPAPYYPPYQQVPSYPPAPGYQAQQQPQQHQMPSGGQPGYPYPQQQYYQQWPQ